MVERRRARAALAGDEPALRARGDPGRASSRRIAIASTRLHSETLLLQRLIADLQDLALADAGGLALERQPVDVAEIVRRAMGPDPGGAPVQVTIEPGAAQPDGRRGAAASRCCAT